MWFVEARSTSRVSPESGVAKGAQQVGGGSGGKPSVLLQILLVHTAAYCIFSGLVVAEGGLLKLGRVSPLRRDWKKNHHGRNL